MKHRAHRRIFLNFVALFLSLTFLAPAFAGDLYKDAATGIQLPAKIGDFQRGEARTYEGDSGEQGASVSIPYDSADATVTFFIRKLAADSKMTASDFVAESVTAAQILESQGHFYANVKILELKDADGSTGWKRGAFTSQKDGEFVVSYTYCKVIDGYLIKVRATTPNPNNEKLLEFLKEIQKITDRAKAGGAR